MKNGLDLRAFTACDPVALRTRRDDAPFHRAGTVTSSCATALAATAAVAAAGLDGVASARHTCTIWGADGGVLPDARAAVVD
jgi:hypothetical protein